MYDCVAENNTVSLCQAIKDVELTEVRHTLDSKALVVMIIHTVLTLILECLQQLPPPPPPLQPPGSSSLHETNTGMLLAFPLSPLDTGSL